MPNLSNFNHLMNNLMKRQFCIGIASALFYLIQLINIGTAKALPVCQSSESATDGCLKIISEPLNIESSDIFEGQTVQKVEVLGTQLPTIHKEKLHTVRWELEVTAGNENNLSVDYVFPNITNPNQTTSMISVQRVETQQPSYNRDSTNLGKVILTGAATFKFDFSAIKASGIYPGKLQIIVTEGQ